MNEDIRTYEFGGNSTRKVRRTNTGQVALEWTLAGNGRDWSWIEQNFRVKKIIRDVLKKCVN